MLKRKMKENTEPMTLKHKIKSMEQNHLVAKLIIHWILQCVKNASFLEYCVYAYIHFNVYTSVYVNIYNR